MKKGRIILGVAAAIATVGGTLAFKATKKFRIHHVLGLTQVHKTHCAICLSLWTSPVGRRNTKCKTINGNMTLVGQITDGPAHNRFAFYTELTVNGRFCINKTTKTTTTF